PLETQLHDRAARSRQRCLRPEPPPFPSYMTLKDGARVRAPFSSKRNFVVQHRPGSDLGRLYAVARHLADDLECGLFHHAVAWILVLKSADGQFNYWIDIGLAARHLLALGDQACDCT